MNQKWIAKKQGTATDKFVEVGTGDKEKIVAGITIDGHFTPLFEIVSKLGASLVGEVLYPGKTYLIQDEFYRQGGFSVTLGANLALLKGREEGDLQALVTEAGEWMAQWFKAIRLW